MEVLVERLTARQRCMNLSYWGFYKAISSVVIAQLMECEILNMVFGLCCLTAPWKMTTTRKTGLIVNLRLLNFPFRSSHTQLQQIGPKVQQDSQSAFVASTSLLPHNTPTTSNPTRDRWSVPRALQASNDKRSAIQTYIREQKSLIWPKSFSDRQCLKHLFHSLLMPLGWWEFTLLFYHFLCLQHTSGKIFASFCFFKALNVQKPVP